MAAFRISLKAGLSDVDHAGLVYYPNIFKFLNVALEGFFAKGVGVDSPTLVLEHRMGFPTVHLETDFKHPIRFGETIEIEIVVEKVGKTSIVFAYSIRNEGVEEVAVRGRKVTVCMDLDRFEKRGIPPWLREKLVALQNAAG